MNGRELDSLSEPDLRIAGLRIWVHGREFPDARDYWDGNWVRITAYCIYPDSLVRTHGPIIHLGEIYGFLRGCERLYESLVGTAELNCIEPNLGARLKAETGGHVKVELGITPDQLTENHSYTDSFDQTFLPTIIAACRRILEMYPVREAENLPT